MRSPATAVAVAVAVAALAAPRGAAAEPGEVDISAGPSTRWMTSPSMDAVSGDDAHALFSLAGSYGVGRIPGVGDVAVGVEWMEGGASGAIFRGIDSEVRLTNLIASARLVRPLASWVSAFARAGLGARHSRLSLEAGADSMGDSGWGSLVLATAGLESAPLRPRPDIAFGLRAEGGYLASDREGFLAYSRDGDDGRIRIPTASAPLGHLDTSGWLLRIGVVARF